MLLLCHIEQESSIYKKTATVTMHVTVLLQKFSITRRLYQKITIQGMHHFTIEDLIMATKVKCRPARTTKKPGPKTVPVKACVRSKPKKLPKCK